MENLAKLSQRLLAWQDLPTTTHRAADMPPLTHPLHFEVCTVTSAASLAQVP
jgi:hypothetical protein